LWYRNAREGRPHRGSRGRCGPDGCLRLRRRRADRLSARARVDVRVGARSRRARESRASSLHGADDALDPVPVPASLLLAGGGAGRGLRRVPRAVARGGARPGGVHRVAREAPRRHAVLVGRGRPDVLRGLLLRRVLVRRRAQRHPLRRPRPRRYRHRARLALHGRCDRRGSHAGRGVLREAAGAPVRVRCGRGAARAARVQARDRARRGGGIDRRGMHALAGRGVERLVQLLRLEDAGGPRDRRAPPRRRPRLRRASRRGAHRGDPRVLRGHRPRRSARPEARSVARSAARGRVSLGVREPAAHRRLDQRPPVLDELRLRRGGRRGDAGCTPRPSACRTTLFERTPRAFSPRSTAFVRTARCSSSAGDT